MRISEIYNKDVYNDSGQYLGEVREAIIDLEKGEVSRLLMEEWKSSNKEEVKKLFMQKSVLYKSIKNIGDVVLVSIGNPHAQEASNIEASELASSRM
jgi:sporulation protein YlmC with PRC-barrel domain